MHSRFHGQIGRGIALTVSVIALSGCVQATRHSNTMVFGTNTTVGFKVGQNVNQVPEIMLAYDRQEAVIMPLLANTVDTQGAGNMLSPCDPMTTPNATVSTAIGSATDYAVHPCSFVAFNGDTQDSYSVLASFGAEFSAEAGGDTKAAGGLAQYFSTGMAAQILAARGGAALVATGSAANQSMSNRDGPEILRIISDSPGGRRGGGTVPIEEAFEVLILTKIRATDPGNLGSRLTAFDQAVGASVAPQCVNLTPEQCASRVDDRDLYFDADLASKQQQVETALGAWTIP